MSPEEASGFKTGGLWTMRFQPTIIPGLWSGMISEFSQESYNDKISDGNTDIRRNQKKQKPGNQGKRRLILSICKESAFPRGLNWVSILDITISVIATTTTIARKTAATTNNTM